MEALVERLVSDYGLLIILLGVGLESLGVPLPGETVLVIGAVYASRGTLNPVAVAAVGITGAVVGDNIGYLVGRRWGRRLTRVRGVRRLYDERRMAVADTYFARHGLLTVFLGRFVALLRIFMGPLAGMHNMPWRHFVAANAAGAVLWVGVVVAAGLLLGGNLDHAVTVIKDAGYAGLGLAVLAVAGLVALHVIRGRRERRHGAALIAAGAASAEPGEPAAS